VSDVVTRRAMVVSLQARGSASLREGHLAAGLLLDAGTVLVTDDPGERVHHPFDVFIVELPLRRPAERIAPYSISRQLHDLHTWTAAMVIGLAMDSTHPPTLPADDVAAGRALIDGVAAGRDVWDDLIRRDIVPADLRHGPSEAVWKELADWPVEDGAPMFGRRGLNICAFTSRIPGCGR
jgi:hypothetical protein